MTLEHNGTELDRIDSSANAPTVNITSPQTGDVWDGGDQTITFPSNDPDGGLLTHIIQYSPDGGQTWLPLDIDVPDDELTIDPSVIEGGPNTHVRVLTTDGVNTSMDEVGPIDVQQQPALQASMAEVDFRKAVLFQGSTAMLELSNPGTGPLHITSVTSNNPEFMAVSPLVPFEVWPGEVRSLELRFVPTSIGEQTATLSIDSDDAEKAILNVGLSGEGVESGVPDAEVSSNAIDFGAVNVGTPAERQVTLTNHGPAPLEVSAITSSNGQFTVLSPATPLDVPVDEQVIVVQFLPGSVGAKGGTLTIASDDPDNPAIVITLAGIGLGGGAGPVPAINMGGVVNAASGGAVLVPGGLGSIFGVNLAGATVAATSIPLPTVLGGVQVTVNGIPAPILFISVFQINFQIPFGVSLDGPLVIIVIRDGVPSAAENAPVALYAPGFFLNFATGEPFVQRFPDFSLISAANPARAGDILILYFNGVGGLTNPPATGSAAVAAPLSIAQLLPTVTLGGVPQFVSFTGLAPGFVALGQGNIVLSDRLPAALDQKGNGVTTLPLVMDFGGSASPPVNLPVDLTVPPAAGADLGVRADAVFPAMAVSKDRISVQYQVMNPDGFVGNVERSLYLSTDGNISPDTDTLVNTRPVTLNGEDQVFDSRFNPLPQDLPLGNYFVGIVLSHPGDPNLANNTSNAVPFDLVAQRPPFDLAAQIDNVDPATVGAGDPVSITYTLTGQNELSGTFDRSFYLSTDATITADNALINTRPVNLLAGVGEVTSANNFIPRFTDTGGYFIGIIVESDGDTNPANNTSAALPVTVTANRTPFDIAVAATSVNPTPVAAGSAIRLEYQVTNTSGTNGSYTRDIYISTDANITIDDTFVNRRSFTLNGNDASLTSSNNPVPAGLAPGNYFVGIIVETVGDTSPGDNNSNGLPLAVTAAAALVDAAAGAATAMADVERGKSRKDKSEPAIASEQAN